MPTPVARFTRLSSRTSIPATIGALALVALTGPAHAAPLFSSPYLMYETGHSPTSVAMADLDGDGWQDLVVTNSAGYTNDPISSVSVMMGTGGGSLGPRTDYEMAGRTLPQAVVIADLDRDGRLDLAVLNYGPVGTVSVLLGNGDGTFGARTDFDAGPALRSLAVADLDHDGRLDLVTEKSVLLGHGDGTFGTRIDFGGSEDYGLGVADLDGDGRLDVMTSNQYFDYDTEGEGALIVRLGHGDGTFGSPMRFGTGYRPYALAIADLDGDGKADVVSANSGSSPSVNGFVSAFLGNGDGTFRPQHDFGTDNNPDAVTIADLDRDGHPCWSSPRTPPASWWTACWA